MDTSPTAMVQYGQSDEPHLQKLLRQVLVKLNLDPSSEEYAETPRRVMELLQSFRNEQDLGALLKLGFENPAELGAMVVQQHIPFRMMCSHHLVPAVGWAAIGYLPHKRVVGLSKLTRLVQAAGTRKPSTQEEITNTIADTLHQTLECLGTIVITKAEHGCMSVRGVNAPGVYTSVSAVRGLFLTNPSAKQEFFDILKLGA